MKRLAIQFSGHLRTFDKTFSSFRKNLILPNQNSGYEIDVFMHVWDELECSEWRWHNRKAPELRGKKLTQTQIDFVKENYKPAAVEITPQLKTDDTTTFPQFTGGEKKYAAMLNACFTKFRVNEIRKEYQQKHNLKYDYVLNTRADILYRKPFAIDDILAPYTTGWLAPFDSPGNKLFYSGYHRGLPVRDERLLAASDIIYFGVPDVMDKVSSIYPTLDKKELAKNFLCSEHYQIIYTTRKHGITPIQTRYAPKNLYAPNYDWEILRLQDKKAEISKSFYYKFYKILIGLVPISKIRRRLKYKLDVKHGPQGLKTQKTTAKIMRKYVDKFLTDKITAFVAAPKQQAGEKIIWQLWWQGLDEKMSKLVRACLDSVEKNKGDYRVIVLDKDSVKNYIDLPDFVYDKLGDGFKMSHFSDLVRLYLLHAYGGVWIDATVYLSAPIDGNLLNQDFFVFQRSRKAPEDRETWEKLNPYYFSWDNNFQVRLTNSFIIAKKGNKLIGDMLGILLDYWKNENNAGNYFFFQILFNRMVNMPEWRGLNCEITNDTDIHHLRLCAQMPYDEALWKTITAKTPIHKLTYFDHAAANSFLAHILNSYEIPYDTPWQNKRDDITFCTMLFRMPTEGDLAKIKQKERKFEDFYLASLEKLVQKFGRTVMWCDKETADFIARKGLDVKTEILEFERLPRYKNRRMYLDFLTEMKEKSFNKGYLLHNLEPENIVNYLILVLSKLDVIKWAAENNFYNTPYLFWLDAGTFNPIYTKFWQNWDGVIDVAPQKAKLVFMTHFKKIYESIIDLTSYEDIALIKAPFEILGGAMAFKTDAVEAFHNAYNDAITFLEKKRLITTEQAVFGTMMKLGHHIDLAKTHDYYDVMNLVAKQNQSQKIRKDRIRYILKRLLLSFIRLVPSKTKRDKLIQKKIYKGVWK